MVSAIAVARNHDVRRAGLVLESLFILWFTMAIDGATRPRLRNGFEVY